MGGIRGGVCHRTQERVTFAILHTLEGYPAALARNMPKKTCTGKETNVS